MLMAVDTNGRLVVSPHSSWMWMWTASKGNLWMKWGGVSHWRESSVSRFSVYCLNGNWWGGKWFAGMDYNKHVPMWIGAKCSWDSVGQGGLGPRCCGRSVKQLGQLSQLKVGCLLGSISQVRKHNHLGPSGGGFIPQVFWKMRCKMRLCLNCLRGLHRPLFLGKWLRWR